MTGMKKKLASLLLMLTLIVCQSPLIAIANDIPADTQGNTQQQEQQATEPEGQDLQTAGTPTGDEQTGLTVSGNGNDAADTVGNDSNTDPDDVNSNTDSSGEGSEEAQAADPAATQDASKKPAALKLGNALGEPATKATKNMKVSSLGHGTIKVNGADYGTEFQSTWEEGTEVNIEAVPDSGYRLDEWRIKSTPSDRSVTTPTTTLVAGTDAEAIATFRLETASVTITAPVAGTTAATKPSVTLPSGAGYRIQEDSQMWGPGLRWVESTERSAATLDPSTVFEAGQTYYARLRLHEGSDSFAATAGGSQFNTNLSVTGGEKKWQSNAAYTEETSPGQYSGYIAIEACIAVTATGYNTGYKDVFIDNTVDKSVSNVTGEVHLTGTGGNQAGYNDGGQGKTVHEITNIPVTYSNPKTAEVQGHINDAYTKAYNTANGVKAKGAAGEFHMSTSETTGRVWDDRMYETTCAVTDGPGIDKTHPIEVEAVSGKKDTYKDSSGKEYTPAEYEITRTHVASGEYGKASFYRVAANGYVSGYTITASNDGKGTATAGRENSLSGYEITISATPAEGYVFDKWIAVTDGLTIEDVNSQNTKFTMPASNAEVKATFKPNHEHNMSKTDEVEPTCTEAGAKAYWTCSVCKKMFSDEAGTTVITTPEVIPAMGHDWTEWKVVEGKEPTETEDGLEERFCKRVDCGAHEERTIPKLVVEYSFVSGDGSSWTRGSTEKLNFVVKRNRADETTIEHFKGLKVDGKDVPSSGYAAKAGSVVIDLMPAYLGTLADGDHTLTAVFDDGNKETSASFKVLSAADKGSKDKANSNKKGSPATGDEAQMLIWLMILCTAGLALSDRIIRRLKNRAADR